MAEEKPFPPGVRQPDRRGGVPRARRRAHQVDRAHPAQRAQSAPREDGLRARDLDAALAELAKVGFDPCTARALKRAIQSEIENPLAKAILEGRFAPKDTIVVDYRGARWSSSTPLRPPPSPTSTRKPALGSPRSSRGRRRSARAAGRHASPCSRPKRGRGRLGRKRRSGIHTSVT